MSRDDIRRTQQYFDSWHTYQDEVQTWFAETYRNCAAALNSEIFGEVLDVGSGGIFNYDLQRVKSIVAVDYSVQAIDVAKMPPGVPLVQGDATKLPFPAGRFDCVMMQFLLHHLALSNHSDTVANVRRCLQESYRVVRPGGKVLVMESFVPGPFELAERVLYPVTRRVLAMIQQPMVFQLSVGSLGAMVRSLSVDQFEQRSIPKGRYISQFGMKVPAYLSPCRVHLFKLAKQAA